MSSTFIEHSPEADGDKSLILIMDGEGNVTADPAHFEKLITNQKLPDMGIKIVRLDSSQGENINDEDSESKPELKLTVEEIYPENLALTSGDPSVNVMNSPLEILPGPSNEHISHDIVDPFSQMDPEQLQRLEHALASEQAKQILGENVAAMLDMLSVDDSPAAFLQNSIKNDHCYTNLLPSSDPNGPSFFMNDTRVTNNGETSKGKGKAKVGTPIKGRKIVSHGTIGPGGNLLKSTVIKEGSLTPKQLHNKQISVADYNAGFGGSHLKLQNDIDDPSYEEDVDVEESEGSAGVDDDNPSDEDYSNRSTRTKKRPRKSKKKLIVRKAGRTMGKPIVKSGRRFGKRSFMTPEMRARNEKLNNAMSKVVESMDYDGKVGQSKSALKRGLNKVKRIEAEDGEIVRLNKPKTRIRSKFQVKTFKSKNAKAEDKSVKEIEKPPEESSPQAKSQPAKYPKRENRKPPAHLAEAFGPALFSTPDIIRRISTGEDLPQTPPEKKNFTVGAHSNPKTSNFAERGITPATSKTEKPKSKASSKDPQKPVKAIKSEHGGSHKEEGESREEKVTVQKLPTGTTPIEIGGGGNKKTNLEIQKLIEKHHHQVKQSSLYEEDQDYSDENIDENYYLDPTQMDQSLLEGFAQTASKSEDQLLQEAILLQEQLIESNKGIVIPEAGNAGLEEGPVEMPFETETIEDIQNEITSAILVARQDGLTEQKRTFEFDGSSMKNVLPPDSDLNKQAKKTEENQFLNEQIEVEVQGGGEQEEEGEGNLVMDENKAEDRRRNSNKRRRSDEVSDLDSDLDDALSEASWNSEDDPDRLWCICRKPHNNRFMICCDVCEEWFHGKCVGITKTIGKQMEQDGLEWSCPNCTKKKKVEEHDREAEKIKILKEKMAQSIKEQQQKIKETQKLKSQSASCGGKEKSIKSPKSSGNSGLKQTKISDFSHPTAVVVSSNNSSSQEFEGETVGRKCIMCKGPVRENSIYCSDDCIRKHSQHAISQLMSDGGKKSNNQDSSSSGQGSEGLKLVQKVRKEDSRIVVMDSNSKKFLVGQNAPTAANLTTWLKENPSYHVVYKKSDKPGKILLTSRKVVKIQSKPGETQKVFVQAQKMPDGVKSTQLKLAVSPNSKQINILQPAGCSASGKKIYQIINSTGPGGKQTAFVVKPKQTEVIEALPLPVKAIPSKGMPSVKPKEATSPKVAATPPASKETTVQKQEKVQRKRKEKVQKGGNSVAAGKDMKVTQKQEETKERDKKDADQQIRDSVRKTLAETLKARVSESKEIEHNDEHIDNLAVKIEEKLFKHFENKVDTKYKSKYRSLIFNIKDPKNETLYKKIVDNSISPKELVKLSPDELASQELARWREKENQHQLEMIKKTELELMTKGNTYIMKSHKGEQMIESDQSEKVAAFAAEIDPNTPAQELVSALNSVTSTTQDGTEEGDSKSKGEKETTLLKAKKKEKERRRSRERKHEKRDRGRKRSSSRSSRSRSHRSKDKKRSRSREREREKEKPKYRHKEKKSEKKRDGDVREGQDSAEEKVEEKTEKSEISTSEDAEEKPSTKSVEDDEADREPSSTVIIKTPDINNVEEPDAVPLWKGSIVMADVAKFNGTAIEIGGDCSGLSYDVGEKVDVVGRIPFATVWDYIARMKKMGTKDILVIKIVPVSEEEKSSYATLYNYLSKRSRIGVIGKTSDSVKDFYLYPLASHSSLPPVLLPLGGSAFESERENVILGIIVRNKRRSGSTRHSVDQQHISKLLKKPSSTTTTTTAATIVEEEALSLTESGPDRSYTPPLPDKDQEKKDRRQKRKIRVRLEKSQANEYDVELDEEREAEEEQEEEEEEEEDDDSPYSPGDSDDDLPPLAKIPKSSASGITTSISKLLPPAGLPVTSDSNLQDATEIQKKIEEMNRAIEEQTQQIQTLTSTVPKLAAGVVLPNLPLLANVTSAILTPASSVAATANPVSLPAPSAAVQSPAPPTEKVQLPLISSDNEESNGPSRSFTPPLKVEENIPFLPEVTSKISLPSNLQEILNSIQKKAEEPEGIVGEAAKKMKKTNPEIDMALTVLNQTKTLLTSLTTISSASGVRPEESKPILSRLTDQELLRKVKEMEMETGGSSDGSSHSLKLPMPMQPPPPPGVQDIPLLPPNGAYSNPPPPAPPPPAPFFGNPLFPPGVPIVEPAAKSSIAEPEEKKPEKRIKLDPKSVFESEGVPDFFSNVSGSGWDGERKGGQQKAKNYKIDIKLTMNSLERKAIDMDHFDIESISKVSSLREERHPASGSGGNPPAAMASKMAEESKFDVDDRVMVPKVEEKYRGVGAHERERRRSDERETTGQEKRDWKYDGRHWDDGRRYNKEDGYRRMRGRRGDHHRAKFRKERFEDKRSIGGGGGSGSSGSRHLQKEWEGSIKSFEERQRWRNQKIRREEMRRSRKRADSSTN